LRLDLVGVAPAFLASTVLGLPYLVSSFFTPSPGWPLLENAAGYWVLFAVLTLALSYLITGIGFDTRRVGPMLQRFGYRIAAVPEGQSTDAYLDRLIERRIPISAAVLITIVALPYALGTLMGIKLPLAGFTGPAVLAGCAIVLDAVRHARGLRVVEAEGPSGDPAESEGHEAATDETAPAGAAATADAEDLPPPEPWQEVFEADTELEANLAQAALSERGIQGVVLSNRVIPWLGTHALWEWTVPTYPNLAIHRRLGEGRVVVRVREHEATRARELLAPFAGAAIPAEAPPS